MSQDEVVALLKETDASSYSHSGSHDRTYTGIIVNGKVFDPFHSEYSWHSVQNNEWDETENEPIDRLPVSEEILTAGIVETHYHYGGNSRARARVQIFTRSVSYQGNIKKALEARATGEKSEEECMLGWSKASSTNKLFLVIDIGEIEGWWPYGTDHPMDVSLLWAIWTAKKNVRVEVDPKIDPMVFCEMSHGFSAGADPRYYRNNRSGRLERLQPDNAAKWFEAEIYAAVKMRDALIAMAPTINRCYWNETTKNEESLSLGVKEDLYKAFQTLWLALPIGHFLAGLGLQ